MKLKKARKARIYFTSGRIIFIDNIAYVMRQDNLLELTTKEDNSYVINLNNVEHYIVVYEEGESEDDADI